MPEPLPADMWAAMLTNVSPERQAQLVDSLLDKACGYRLWVTGGKKPGGHVMGARVKQARITYLREEDGEEEEGWVYTLPPDPLAARTVLEHGIGRPGVRELVKQDTAIFLVHRVPGRRDIGPKPEDAAEAPAEETAGDDPVLEMGLGLASVLTPEPEDVLSDED